MAVLLVPQKENGGIINLLSVIGSVGASDSFIIVGVLGLAAYLFIKNTSNNQIQNAPANITKNITSDVANIAGQIVADVAALTPTPNTPAWTPNSTTLNYSLLSPASFASVQNYPLSDPLTGAQISSLLNTGVFSISA